MRGFDGESDWKISATHNRYTSTYNLYTLHIHSPTKLVTKDQLHWIKEKEYHIHRICFSFGNAWSKFVALTIAVSNPCHLSLNYLSNIEQIKIE